MRHLFILNPAAGKRGTTRQLEGLLERLRVPHEVVYTGGAGDAERFAREAAATVMAVPNKKQNPAKIKMIFENRFIPLSSFYEPAG